MGNRKILIVADDLTGAMDTSACFSSYGLSGVVSVVSADARPGNEVLHSVNAATRECTTDVARAEHLRIGEAFRSSERIVIKKTDMGFRGNHGAEIEGLMRGLGARVCYVVNAVPDHNTFVLNARQYVKGKLLPESRYAQDPTHRPETACIPDILGAQTELPIGTIGIGAVRSGTLATEIERHIRAGNRILVFDVITEADCEAVVRLTLRLPHAAIWAGTLGVMNAMAATLGLKRRPPCPRAEHLPKCLCFTTSNYDTVQRQLARARREGLVQVEMNIDVCLKDEVARRSEHERCMAACREQLRKGSVILTQRLSPKLARPGIGQIILENMTACAEALCAGRNYERLVIIGGETSTSILRTIGADRLVISAQPETGVALGRLDRGICRGISFAAKGGSVGTDEALCSMLTAADVR